jgi:hypothetical protein
VSAPESPRREYHYTVDRHGTLHHAGDPITHERVLRQFYRNLRYDSGGRLLSICGGEYNYLEAEDTPFVVLGVQTRRGADGRLAAVDLVLNDHSVESLDVGSLEIGSNDVLYCRVRAGQFRARFQRGPHVSLLRFAEEREGAIVIEVGGLTVCLASV